MVEICINGSGLGIAGVLAGLLAQRSIAFIETPDVTKDPQLKSAQAETFVCSSAYQASFKGADGLVEVARSLKAKRIIVINEDQASFSMHSEMGGRTILINLPPVSVDPIISHTVYGLQVITALLSGPQHVAVGAASSLNMLALAKRVSQSDVTVFINGPTGTGKEVQAKYIHNNSPRAAKPFVAVNCAAIPENMLEAILFGHEKGAFTGASTANKGIFRAADGGTLLLDEISEMPMSLQAKLLRALQEKSVTPIGSHEDIKVDVRVVATTNRDMPSEIQKGNFREDLFYRLNVFPLNTAPLAERIDDIIPIASALLRRHVGTDLASWPWLDDSATNALLSYHWPGNVRELENVLQRSLVLTLDGVITANEIFTDMHSSDVTRMHNNALATKLAVNG